LWKVTLEISISIFLSEFPSDLFKKFTCWYSLDITFLQIFEHFVPSVSFVLAPAYYMWSMNLLKSKIFFSESWSSFKIYLWMGFFLRWSWGYYNLYFPILMILGFCLSFSITFKVFFYWSDSIKFATFLIIL